MNVDMTRSLAFTFCTTDGGTTIAVQKRSCGAESFNDGLETEYRFQIDLETWGDNKVDNNVRGDIKVDIKVDNKVDIKVDNNIWDDTVNRSRIDQETTDDTVNDTVKHPQTRTRTTTPYNTRTSPVQHPYKKRRCRLGRVMGRAGFCYGPLNGSLNGSLSGPLSGLKSGPLSGLNETDSKFIGFIQSNPSVTIQELQAILNLSRNGVRKANNFVMLKSNYWETVS